ncbi:MAG: adenosylhomocysteinase, partial [Acidimicrobiales bacterium]
AGSLSPSVHDLPAAIDEEIARLKIAAMGVAIDELSRDQKTYLATWGVGT